MSVIIRIENLALAFGEKTKRVLALENVNLDINKGELFVIMGLSGSGKSSLLRTMNGLNGPHGQGCLKGEILFFKQETVIHISQCSKKELAQIRKKHIAMVFQQAELLPWRTVYENVALPLELSSFSKKDMSEKITMELARVNLLAWKDHFPHQLSGGMQQRVGVARALATDADVLLMDEPFSALDPITKQHLQTELLQIQKALQKTIVFVSHDFQEAKRLAFRMAIMDKGSIIQSGTSSEIEANPANSIVQQFVQSTSMNPTQIKSDQNGV